MMNKIFPIFSFVFLLFSGLYSQDSTLQNTPAPSKKGIVITLEEMVDGGMASYTKRAVQNAVKQNPDYIIFEVNTFGGELMAAFDIVDEITAISDIHTVAYVQKKAISAGALISLACRSVYMSPSSTIGDVAPVVQGDSGPVVLGEKIQSPLRAKFRNLSQRNGYPELLSQAMVTQGLEVIEVKKQDSLIHLEKRQFDAFPDSIKKEYQYIQTLVRSDELLTMTDKEAQKYGFSKGTLPSLDSLKKKLNIAESQAVAISWAESLTRFIGSIAPLLMLIGFGALYMEYQTPGFGVFGITGIIALCIVFAGPYVAGLAEHTELALMFLAIVLTLVEMYVMPGTFIAGFSGLIVFMIALAMVFSRDGSNTQSIPDLQIVGDFLAHILLYGALALVFPLISARFILPKISRRSGLMLEATIGEASIATQYPLVVGQVGKSVSPLRPTGTGEFEGKRYDVQSVGQMIDPGVDIILIEIRGQSLFVREASHEI